MPDMTLEELEAELLRRMMLLHTQMQTVGDVKDIVQYALNSMLVDETIPPAPHPEVDTQVSIDRERGTIGLVCTINTRSG